MRNARTTLSTSLMPVVLLVLCGQPAAAQPSGQASSARAVSSSARAESVTVAASLRYDAGSFYRWLVGSPNRDLWATPIRVPVLDLQTYAGGLRMTKTGGGMQTKSIRFESATGEEYVFRLADKTVTAMPEAVRHTVVERILQDQVSAMHPAGGVMSAPMADASGVLHPTAVFMALPDDSMLGASRAEFAGRLGMLERYPNVPKHGPGFAGASAIIDSDSLLVLLNGTASERVNERAFLAARLMDILINDNDRHAGNWKWARLGDTAGARWEPIARDRDHAFISFDGAVMRMSRLWSPMLVELSDTPIVPALTKPSLIDARLLVGLERPVWDSVASALQARITDSVIHAVVSAMPAEFHGSASQLEATLRTRRDALPRAAGEFYHLLATRVQVHGTDAADHVIVAREGDASVIVSLESNGTRGYVRRFDPRETKEILVYLHGGDDTAQVTGNVPASILVRVIGGNGNNRLLDESTVDGKRQPTHLYDTGPTSGISYGPDTMFNRRPWEMHNGELAPHQKDNGSAIKPLAGLSQHRRLGLTPYLGVVRYGYGFDRRPYSSMVKAQAEYAVQYGGSMTISADKRREASPIHFLGLARVSRIEFLNFNGLGNATIDSGSRPELTAVHQTQTVLRPAIGLALGSRWDLSLGPVIRQTNTDSARSPYVAANGTYGIGHFTQAGVQFEARYEWRSVPTKAEHTHHRAVLVFNGTYTPAAFDVRSAFTAIGVAMGTSVTLPVPLQPLLVVRAGGSQLFGEFPFYDAATIGSGGPMRYMDPQRYAGDAAVYATSELRVPLAHFTFLMPIRMGVLGLHEAGRVYVDGSSPGGWHSQVGAGVWFARGYSSPVVTIARTTEQGHSGVAIRFGLNF